MAEKLRIHQLAKELSVESKIILAKCHAEDVEVKNHMSTVSAGLAETIREWFSESAPSTAVETSEKVDLQKVRKKRAAARKKAESSEVQEPVGEPALVAAEVSAAAADTAPLAAAAADAGPPTVVVQEPATRPTDLPPAPAPEPPDSAPESSADESVEEAEEIQKPTVVPHVPPQPAEPIKPLGPQNIPQPAQLKGPRVIRVEAPEPVSATGRHPAGPRYRQASMPTGEVPAGQGDAAASRRSRARTYRGDEEDASAKRKAAVRRSGRGSDAGDRIREWRNRDLEERQERLRGATGRRAKRRASESRGSIEHRAITEAQVTEPIVLKHFCSATGLAFSQLTPKFINELKTIPNINMVLDRETAQLLASEFGIDLKVLAAENPLDEVRLEFKERQRPALASRAPVVTFLGHVDHGKTSLLDAIRHSRVTEGEAGGITQHMGSYHLKRDGLAVTFLDTPGHSAFTAMRARGAQMTDVVVLVVAADDGVMPQTVEAINHAKAAQVPIVVALNKMDLPGVDLNQVYGQLSEHDLAPSEWGGSTDVIKTSATQGTGIDTLIEHLSTLSELLELKADPTIAACGRVIEAQMKPGVGVVARVLIQDGCLRRGDIFVCGPGYGKIRLIKDDQANTITSAGPSMPVELSGMDELPAAGDEFFQVASLRRAEQIATQVREQRRRDSLSSFNKPKTLEDLFGQRSMGEIPELNVIVKADVQGSVDVLRKTLSEFPSEEVKLNILHAGVGTVSESDVLLAEASGAIIIGFQIAPDNQVRRMAESEGVDIRTYRVIYNVIDDIKKALEGLLEPEQKLEQRGMAEVRSIFKVSKVGTVAGCYIREGAISRHHRVRVIRDGVVVRDDSSLQSLRRFKDDVKEVKAGYECGIRVEGFDDVKPQDVIEAYEVVKIARTL